MYRSHSFQEKVFSYFSLFLNKAIAGEEGYATIVRPALEDAHSLATGTKNYFAIDRSFYPVVVFLVEKDADYFRSMDAEEISTPVYRRALEILNNQSEIVVA